MRAQHGQGLICFKYAASCLKLVRRVFPFWRTTLLPAFFLSFFNNKIVGLYLLFSFTQCSKILKASTAFDNPSHCPLLDNSSLQGKQIHKYHDGLY